jgi:hypothetical protein
MYARAEDEEYYHVRRKSTIMWGGRILCPYVV